MNENFTQEETMAIMEQKIKEAEDAFVSKPSQMQLQQDLETVAGILNAQSSGQKVWEEDGKIFTCGIDGFDKPLGPALRNINEISGELFGDTPQPEGVEYTTIDGLTFLTYYGEVVAIGKGDISDSRDTNGTVHMMDKTLNSKTASVVTTLMDDEFLQDVVKNARVWTAMAELMQMALAFSKIHAFI